MDHNGYDWNGPQPRVKPRGKLASLRTRVNRLWTQQLAQVPPVRLGFLLMTLALLTLFVGCATQSPPESWPRNPQPPQLSEPIPTESYLSRAQKLIESWRSAVTGM